SSFSRRTNLLAQASRCPSPRRQHLWRASPAGRNGGAAGKDQARCHRATPPKNLCDISQLLSVGLRLPPLLPAPPPPFTAYGTFSVPRLCRCRAIWWQCPPCLPSSCRLLFAP